MLSKKKLEEISKTLSVSGEVAETALLLWVTLEEANSFLKTFMPTNLMSKEIDKLMRSND